MKVVITYWLSPTGQKSSILQGGDGKAQQELLVDPKDSFFSQVVQEGAVTPDGNVYLTVYNNRKLFDAPQTVGGVLAFLKEEREGKLKKEQEEKDERRRNTLDVWEKRETRTHIDQINLTQGGTEAKGPKPLSVCEVYQYVVPNWPYYPDEDVVNTEEALQWASALRVKKEEARERALATAKQKLAEQLAQKKEERRQIAAREMAKLQRIFSLGGDNHDLLLFLNGNYLTELPPRCWEEHSRSKNWMALITPDPDSPGGLQRTFLDKYRKEFHYYILPDLGGAEAERMGFQAGRAVEFGADYYTSKGSRQPHRWYGFIVARTDEYLLLRACESGRHAYNAGQRFLKDKAKKEGSHVT